MGDITPEDSDDFLAELEKRHRSDTFFANVIGYTVVGTKKWLTAGVE